MKITSTVYPEIGPGEIVVIRNRYDPSQPRNPKGSDTGGQWKGTGQGGSLSNGKGKDITNTPQFKAWFGNSKVVDAEGKPLVVYHGTQGEFTEFAPKRTGHGELAYNNSFYFTSEKENASTYANPNSTKGNVMEVFLSIQNPKIVYSIEDMRIAERTAKRKGYDGIIAKGVKDGNVWSDVYIAFYQTQIKSTSNSGAFDPTDPSILNSEILVIRHGGKGSGNIGHAGIPGHQGGSMPKGGSNLIKISDIDDKEIEKKIRKICDEMNFPYDKIYMSKEISTVLGEYKTETDYIVLSPSAMGDKLQGVLAHEITHAQTADVLKEYFKQSRSGEINIPIFKALSGKVSDCLERDNCIFTDYIKFHSDRLEDDRSVVNKFYVVSEGLAEYNRMKVSGEKYPPVWEDLDNTIKELLNG